MDSDLLRLIKSDVAQALACIARRWGVGTGVMVQILREVIKELEGG